MFFPRSQPVTVTRDEIRGLRLSLNTPVVATEEIPIGPARAAILVHEGRRGPEVTIGIRSLRADRTALYGFEGDLREASSFAVALDAALSFAESMGFLFDEDELGSGGAAARVRCLGLWRDLLGDDAVGGAVPARAAGGEPGEELLLEELAEDAGAEDSSDAVLGSFSDASAPEGATDVFVPEFEGEAAPGNGAAFAAAGAAAFAPGPAAPGELASAGVGPDDESSFANLLDPSDEPVPSDSSDDPSDEPDKTVAEPPPPAAARAAASAPLVSLTKFRGGLGPAAAPSVARGAEREAPERAPAAAAAATAKRAKQALGKLRLIRRSRGGGAASAAGRKRHPILRLFGSF